MSPLRRPRAFQTGAYPVLIRPPRADEKESLLRLQARSFGKDVPFFRRIWDSDPRHSDETARLLLEGSVPVAYLRYAPWRMHLRGAVVRFGGLAEVCSLPRVRGRGYLWRLMERILPDHLARGYFINLLHGDPNLYRRFGWETACDFAYARRPVARIRFPKVPGRVRPYRDSDLPFLKKLYNAKAGRLSVMVARDDLHWRGCVIRKWNSYASRPWVYEDRKGLRGYAFVKTENPGGEEGRRIKLVELTVETLDAAWALAAQACRGARPGDVLSSRGPGSIAPPASTPLGGEGSSLHIEGGSMARLIDSQAFLNEMGPALGLFSGSVRLDIQDPFPFLHRDLVLIRGQGRLRAEKERRSSRSRGAVKTAVGSLTQLVLGYRSAETLSRLGLMKGPASSLAKLDKAFPPQAAYQEEIDDY